MLLEKELWWIQEYFMRILKWSLDFNPSIEILVAPICITLHNLPMFLFNKQAYISHAASKPIKVDETTLELSRQHCARICVELNLINKPKEYVNIQIGNMNHKQKITSNGIPPYSNHCKRIGNKKKSCNIKKMI